MHSSLLFLIGFLTVLSGIQSAKKHRCGKELKLNQCLYSYKNGTDDILFATPCNKGEKCIEVEPMDKTDSRYQCVKTSIYEGKKEGESCIISDECESKICHDGKCMFLPDYTSNCKNHYQCGYSSYCDDSCLPLKKAGEKCNDEDECELGLFCGKYDDKPNTCVEMYSLENGRATDFSFFCQSGYTYKLSESKKEQCVSIAVSNSTCDEKNECKYIIDNGSKSEEVTMRCLTNNEGEYYCAQQTGSQAFKDYVKVYKEEVQKSKGKVRPTMLTRYNLKNEKVIKALLLYSGEGYFYPEPKDDNEKCLNEFYIQQESSFSLKFSLGLFLLSLLLF